MNPRIAEIRDTGLLSGALVFGCVLSVLIPLVGLPLAAMGAAGLLYRGRVAGAVVGAVAGCATAGILYPESLVFVVPSIAAVLLAAVMVSRFDVQWVAAVLAGTFTLAGTGFQVLLARADGKSLNAWIGAQLNQAIAQDAQIAGGSAGVQAMRDATKTMLELIPAYFFVSGLIMAVAVIVGLGWAAKRSEATVRIPKLSQLDLTPHVLWPFVMGLLALAASYSSIPNAAALGVVGLNLVWCAGAVFSLQGLGVTAGVLDRTGVGLGGRILAWAALAVLDALSAWTLFGFIGLLDFWINFRRLPRDGESPSSPEAAVSDRL